MAKPATSRKPSSAGKPVVLGSQRNAIATARNKGQQGALKRNVKAAGKGKL